VEDLNRVPDDLAAHLDECAACQAWRRKCRAVEQLLTRLPVPESDGLAKAALLEKIRSAPVQKRPAAKPAAPRLPSAAPPLPEAPLKPVAPVLPARLNLEDDLPKKKWSIGKTAAKLWPAGLVAATLLVFAVLYLSVRNNQPPPRVPSPPDPLLDSLVKLNVELATTKTPVERVNVLARVADELNHEMREIARADATGENMQALEGMYRDVVLKGLLDQAKLVDNSQREVVLGKVEKSLALSARQADEMAEKSPQHSAVALKDAAETAREGTKRIRRLIQEALSS
jgi:hypothetical protein